MLKRHVHKVSSHVCTSSHYIRYIKISNFTLNSWSKSLDVTFVMVSFVGKHSTLWKSYWTFCVIVRQGHMIQFSQWHHLVENVKVYKCLPHIFYPRSYHFKDFLNLKLYFKNFDKVTEYNFRNDTVQWQVSKSTAVCHTSLRKLLPFQRIKNVISELQKVGQGHSTISRNYVIWLHMSKSTNVILYAFDFR